jgi:ribosome biogenesis GTPase
MMLEKIGFSGWFQERINRSKLEQFQLARVIAVNKDNYIIKNEKNEVQAEITGKIMYDAESPLDYPAVGDWVYVQYFDDNLLAIIHEIFPRKTILKRKTAGKKIEFQIIAANINTAFIMQSLDNNYNLRRLERYLVMVKNSEIRPIVLLSKRDLISEQVLQERINEILSILPDLEILAFSNFESKSLNAIKKLLIPGDTYCLLGSSGVGKSSLINNLLGKEVFETREVREKDSRGRHATARRQLIVLENSAMIIDTPGMRELGNFAIETGIEETFDEISILTKNCKFNNCSHMNEMGCAVLKALQEGQISQERYQNYLKMIREAAHYERSYFEKRKRDKEFGKMIKSIMKNKKKK